MKKILIVLVLMLAVSGCFGQKPAEQKPNPTAENGRNPMLGNDPVPQDTNPGLVPRDAEEPAGMY